MATHIGEGTSEGAEAQEPGKKEENQNIQAVVPCRPSVAAMTKDLQSYDEQYSRTISDSHEDIGLLLKSSSAKVRDLLDSMPHVSDVINKGLNDMHLALEHHVHGINEGLDKFIAESKEVRDSEVMRIVDFNQRTVAEQMSSVVGALNAVAADLEGLRVALNDQGTVQQRMVTDFVKNQLIQLSTYQEMMESYCIQQTTAIESLIKNEQGCFQEFTDLINRTDQKIREAVRGERLSDFSQTSDEFLKIQNDTEDFQNGASGAIEQLAEVSQNGCHELVEQSQACVGKNEQMIGNVVTSIETGHDTAHVHKTKESSEKFCKDSEM